MKNIEAGIIKRGTDIKKEIQIAVFIEGDINEIKLRDPESFILEAEKYAAKAGVFLVPGLYIKDGHLCSCLIDNNGKLAGEQKGTHLNTYLFNDLKRGSGINVIDTPFGRIFLCVDVDIYKPEVIRIAALSGADIVICSQFINAPDYSEEMILAGPWQEAQQNCLYILSSTNHGGNIIGPCSSTEDLSGYLARGSINDNIYSSLSPEKKKEAYRSFPVFDSLNNELYNKHLKELCR